MQVGAVSYINALPFVIPLQKQFPLTLAPPKQINELLISNKISLALTSSILSTLPIFDTIDGYGIAAKGAILSVLLHSSLPIDHLSGQAIALDPASETSNALLKILCSMHWKITPTFVSIDAPHQARLVIGDAALKNRHPLNQITTDLATAWYEMTALPFVFALFVTRQKEVVSSFTQALAAAITWSEQNVESIINHAHHMTRLPVSLLQTYFSTCTYRLTDEHMKGYYLFKELLNVSKNTA